MQFIMLSAQQLQVWGQPRIRADIVISTAEGCTSQTRLLRSGMCRPPACGSLGQTEPRSQACKSCAHGHQILCPMPYASAPKFRNAMPDESGFRLIWYMLSLRSQDKQFTRGAIVPF